eukprot:169327-Karenia_brevis.AAC.1
MHYLLWENAAQSRQRAAKEMICDGVEDMSIKARNLLFSDMVKQVMVKNKCDPADGHVWPVEYSHYAVKKEGVELSKISIMIFKHAWKKWK